ncbi:MAG: DNA replication and repair protein RecF [Candidatus Saccharimonadales bacterium]
MITSIRLQHFRTYKNASFEFDPGVNIVVGPNASGKTNLLEAVLVLARGSSYRAKDTEIISHDKPWGRVDGDFAKQKRSVKLERDGEKVAKNFVIDEKPYKRLALERTVPVVFFEPNHLQILSRGPEWRREYFDELLERSLPEFKPLSVAYRRTLAQRNALLKQNHQKARQQLFAWDIRLSQLGEKIAYARKVITDDINKQISRSYSKIAGRKSVVSLRYESHFPVADYASKLLRKLEASASLDFMRGFTSSGPHREDFSFFLNGQPVSASASRGEARSLLLALKVFELGLIEEARSQKPLFLLDDVFSELDTTRRRALVNYLKDYQAIITTTDADTVVEYFATGAHKLIPLQKAAQ